MQTLVSKKSIKSLQPLTDPPGGLIPGNKEKDQEKKASKQWSHVEVVRPSTSILDPNFTNSAIVPEKKDEKTSPPLPPFLRRQYDAPQQNTRRLSSSSSRDKSDNEDTGEVSQQQQRPSDAGNWRRDNAQKQPRRHTYRPSDAPNWRSNN